MSYLNPCRTGLIGAPTYPMLREATLTALLEALDQNDIPDELNRARELPCAYRDKIEDFVPSGGPEDHQSTLCLFAAMLNRSQQLGINSRQPCQGLSVQSRSFFRLLSVISFTCFDWPRSSHVPNSATSGSPRANGFRLRWRSASALRTQTFPPSQLW